MYKRILAIGDIHGEYEKLLSLYEKIHFKPEEDLLIFLGDYMDRGKKPLGVMEWLLEHKDIPNLIMLRGNHDQMFLDYEVPKREQKNFGWIVPDYKYGWFNNGGLETLAYFEEKRKNSDPWEFLEFKAKCLSFIGNLPLFYQVSQNGEDYFFCHAGIKPSVALDKQDPHDLLWIREEFWDNYQGENEIIVGHTPIILLCNYLGLEKTNYPLIRNNIIFLDTAACYGGSLSCMNVLTKEIWQSD